MFMSQRGHKNSVCLHRDSWALSALILESCHSSGIKYADQAFMGWQALLNREGFYLSWTEQPVLPIVGILTEEPAWALTSGCHSVQGSILP